MPEEITPFKRGSTFAFTLKIPDNIPNGFFKSWVPTAQLRKEKNSSPAGLIAQIECFWADPSTTRYLVIYHGMSSGWPVGRAEFDVLFQSSAGEKIRSTTKIFNIERGITT